MWCAVQPGSGCGAHSSDKAPGSVEGGRVDAKAPGNVEGGRADARVRDSRADIGTDCPFADWEGSGQDVHSLVGVDPLFKDASSRVFTLRSESPALKLGITSIDTSRVGPQQ